MLVCVVLSCMFLVALWSPNGKGLTSWQSCSLCFVIFPNVSWSTSELRARLAPKNLFKPSKIFLLTVPDREAVLLLWIIHVFVMLLCAPRGHLLGKG